MTTEYMLEPGQSHEELARDLLDQAASPDQVHWSPRPDVFGGGVYVVADEAIAQRTREVRAARRAEEARRTESALAAADERDSNPDVAEGLLTPAEAGFSANAGVDPGSAGEAEANAAAVEAGQRPDAPRDAAQSTDNADGADDADEDEDSAGGEGDAQEPRLTPAEKRARTREAKKQAAAQADAEDEKPE